MNVALRFLLLAASALVSPLLVAGERVGDFALIDHTGTQHHMSWYDDQHAVVILPQAVGMTDGASLSAMQALQREYAAQGVVFFLLNPGLQTDRQAVADAVAGVRIPVLMDDAQVSWAGAVRTGTDIAESTGWRCD